MLSFTRRQQEILLRAFHLLPAGLLLVWVVAATAYAVVILSLPGEPDPASIAPAPAAWQIPERPPPAAWEVFNGADNHGSGQEPLSNRFRFAGTWFLKDGEETDPVRTGVLEDLDRQVQHEVQEGSVIDGIEVVEIRRDWIRLWSGTREELLRRSFLDLADASGAGLPETAPAAELRWDERVIEENRFGRRIKENRWILWREELLRYRDEVLDDPERVVALFDSMKADRLDGQVAGYRLNKVGEHEFYDSIGLRENDVVRKVNSMHMTKQERAMYFITEFVQDRLGAVVLDIERDGQPQKLIYYLR